MSSYFDEHDCEPTDPEEQYRQNALLELARSLMQGLDVDFGSLDVSEWDQRLPPPAAKTVVQSLPLLVISPQQADKGLKCPVCLLEFEEQETVREMPCKHLFHSSCILPWLGKTNSCPLCRLELPTDNPDYEEFKKDKLSLSSSRSFSDDPRYAENVNTFLRVPSSDWKLQEVRQRDPSEDLGTVWLNTNVYPANVCAEMERGVTSRQQQCM
ncbi:hypothetical protein QTP70_027948 [Hemibagrus guttatus]|uniref:E3 ubiquitin-protein ligase RNF181 n=1 Tax=Hemibagrus guttatus TaxID=175788 RepID=A0AAE0URC5_9TELE|nr:hypothetical protein QTP70_027948 [Hemibagrus guttatus]